MSNRDLKKLYRLVETAYPDDYLIHKNIAEAIYTLSARIRLIEVRIEEMERRTGWLESSVPRNNSLDMIDGREISILVGNKRGESR